MVEKKLNEEIDKWSEKLDQKIPKLRTSTEKGKRILKNIRAYREDSEHFLEDGKLVESFESLIWAWAWLEIGEELDHIEERE